VAPVAFVTPTAATHSRRHCHAGTTSSSPSPSTTPALSYRCIVDIGNNSNFCSINIGMDSLSIPFNDKLLFHHRRRTSSSSRVCLSSSKNNNNNNNDNTKNKSSSARERGIYARPSAAIERGSGFFIPGLEGSRIRLLFGIVAVVLVVANHFFLNSDVVGDGGDGGVEYGGMVIAELIAAFYGTMLILQGSIDFGVERSSSTSRSAMVGSEDNSNGGNDANLRNEGGYTSTTYGKLGDDSGDGLVLENAIQRISRAFVAYTPATEVRLVSEDYGILFAFGSGNISKNNEMAVDDSNDDQKQLIKLCLDAVSSSRGGSRVALPPDHPSSKLLPVDATRCILVQKVNDYRDSRTCIIVGSDKLLPSFTKNDLRWLGQLAQYSNLMSAQ
jgi:hypothetical protein